jgi:hypothetical protein
MRVERRGFRSQIKSSVLHLSDMLPGFRAAVEAAQIDFDACDAAGYLSVTSLEQRKLLGTWSYADDSKRYKYHIHAEKGKLFFIQHSGDVVDTGELVKQDEWLVAEVQSGRMCLRLENDEDHMISNFTSHGGETRSVLACRQTDEEMQGDTPSSDDMQSAHDGCSGDEMLAKRLQEEEKRSNPCRYWNGNSGSCRNGDQCPYGHDKQCKASEALNNWLEAFKLQKQRAKFCWMWGDAGALPVPYLANAAAKLNPIRWSELKSARKLADSLTAYEKSPRPVLLRVYGEKGTSDSSEARFANALAAAAWLRKDITELTDSQVTGAASSDSQISLSQTD